jgi:CRISPR type III-B/RAMP module-associated protein Cmr5
VAVYRTDRDLAVVAAEALGDKVSDDLRTRMRALPVMISTNGLTAAAAFLLSRNEVEDDTNPYWRTARIVLTDAAAFIGLHLDADPRQMLMALATADEDDYLAAEARALGLARWLSRLAQALSSKVAST